MNQESKPHGFMRPFHPMQIISWVLAAFLTLSVTIVTIHFLPLMLQIVFGLIYYLTALGAVVFTVFCTKCDPTDPIVYQQRAAQNTGEEFDTSRYTCMCNICATSVATSSKHWGDWNRCVEKFDHHCKWMNNCIGGKNYGLFVAVITWVEINMSTLFAVTWYQTIVIFSEDFDSVSTSEDVYDSNIELFARIIIFLCMIISLITTIGNANLIILHIWLKCKNMTTYEYIQSKRKAKAQVMNSELANSNPGLSKTINPKMAVKQSPKEPSQRPLMGESNSQEDSAEAVNQKIISKMDVSEANVVRTAGVLDDSVKLDSNRPSELNRESSQLILRDDPDQAYSRLVKIPSITMGILLVLGVFVVLVAWGKVKTILFLWISLCIIVALAGWIIQFLTSTFERLTGLYITTICMAPLTLLGATCLFTQRNSLEYFVLQAEDLENWKLSYEDSSPLEISEAQEPWVRGVGLVCLSLAIILLLMLVPIGIYAERIRQLQTVLELQISSMALFSMIALILGLMCHQFYTDKDVAEVVNAVYPYWIASLACILMILSLTYYMSILRVRTNLADWAMLGILITAAALGYCGYQTLDETAGFDTGFNCLDVIARVDEDFMFSIGCNNKYTDISPLASELDCEKSLITEDWEEGDGLFACLNQNCCAVIRNSIRAYFEIMAITAFVVSTLAGVVAILSFFTRKELYPKDDKQGYIVLAILMGSLFFSSFYALFIVLPASIQAYPGDREMPGRVIDGGYAANQLISITDTCSNFTLGQYNFTTGNEDLEKVFSLDIKSSNVQVKLARGVEVSDAEVTLHFNYQSRNEIPEVRFWLLCPEEEAWVTMSGNMKTMNGTDKLSEENLIKRHFSILPAFGEANQTISGYTDPETIVSSQLPHWDKSRTAMADSSGLFEIPHPMRVDMGAYETMLTYENGQTQLDRRVRIGGLPLTAVRSLPNITLTEDTVNGSLQVTVVDFKSNNALKTDQKLFNANNERITNFQSIPSGVYTLKVSKPGFLGVNREVQILPSSTSMQPFILPKDNLGGSLVRATLSKSDPAADIDLHVLFKSSDDDFCHIYYAHKRCGGSVMETLSRGGEPLGESLLLEIKPTFYLVYAQATNTNTTNVFLELFTGFSNTAVTSLSSQVSGDEQWLAVCLNGRQGISSIIPVNYHLQNDATFSDLYRQCEYYYGVLESVPETEVELVQNLELYAINP